MSDLITHLEEHLGPIEGGWSKDEMGVSLPFQVVRFSGGPVPGTSTYSTLGLSNHALKSPRSEKSIRHEIVFIARRALGDQTIPGVIQQLASEALQKKRPYLRGDLVGPRGPLFPDSKLEAIYMTVPVYFPGSFASFVLASGTSGVIAWAVPVTREEALFIRNQGWTAFEEMLAEQDPDLLDFARDGMLPP